MQIVINDFSFITCVCVYNGGFSENGRYFCLRFLCKFIVEKSSFFLLLLFLYALEYEISVFFMIVACAHNSFDYNIIWPRGTSMPTTHSMHF